MGSYASRARGANIVLAHAFEADYGVSPGSGYRLVSVSSQDLGDEQGRVKSDLLGRGRKPQPSSLDVINNRGSLVVPVDQRLIGVWLKQLLGAPTTTQGVAATGQIAFAANPAANDTITVGGQAFTFKSSAPTANQILIESNLAKTLRNAVRVLNTSAVAGVAAARYALNTDLNAIVVTHKTVGTAGNSFALAASVATPSGSTLSGGSTSGPYNHVFKAGSQSLPSASVEVGNTDVGQYRMNYGIMIDSLSIPLARSGNLSATLAYIAQGEKAATGSTGAGTPAVLAIDRFSQFAGVIDIFGAPIGNVVSGQVVVNNGLDVAENIRRDGRIDGADPGELTLEPQFTARFGDQYLLDLATNDTPVTLSFGWAQGAASLTFRYSQVRLPKPKFPVSGPGSIQASFTAMGETDAANEALEVILVNDVANYD
ncbi:hypothetical protein J2X45_003400 [Caulobacter sp. BE264]|uniref:phage tail tube protein n=1 Tax=Caulobacter sp. BE264 TaxID=2817724 RepID=UPI002863C372|nr:phage tail tube protein [Caulobacter sp. BE264]MDR7232294.1 hypothetical protein [Caulobacter sp. BE264]